MCLRYTLQDPRRIIRASFARCGAVDQCPDEGFPPARYNIAPSQRVPTVYLAPDGRLTWGLRPWGMAGAGEGTFGNARIETVMEKPSFRASWLQRRCLIPADGFYEWTGAPRDRRTWFFEHPHQEPLLMAGLYASDERTTEGLFAGAFCLLTTEANALMRPIHDRMPVLIQPGEERAWLETVHPGERFRAAYARPAPESFLCARRVSSYVNRAGNEGPECLQPPTSDLGPLFDGW